MGSLPPFLPFFVAAALVPALGGRVRGGGSGGAAGARRSQSVPPLRRRALAAFLPGQRPRAGAGGPAEPAVRLPVPHRRAARDRLRAASARPLRDRRRAGLRGLRPRRGVRGRPDHPVRVLGADGGELSLPDLGTADRAGGGRGPALSRRAGPVGGAAARRGGGAPAGDRHPGVHLHRPRRGRGLAHLHRVRDQVRLPVPAQLAHRRLPGGDPDGDGVPLRVHHQGGGVRARARLPRHRDARLHRRGDDLLPDLLRGDRETISAGCSPTA